jgi:hypothetical protein
VNYKYASYPVKINVGVRPIIEPVGVRLFRISQTTPVEMSFDKGVTWNRAYLPACPDGPEACLSCGRRVGWNGHDSCKEFNYVPWTKWEDAI